MFYALRPTLTLLALAAVLPAAESAAIPVRGPQNIQLDAGKLANVAEGRFFLSNDEGKTWTLAKKQAVDPKAPVVPFLTFAPATDGVWLVVTATTWRTGTPEADPKPGTIPAKHLRLLVDNTPPVIQKAEFTAEPVTEATANFTVNADWASVEANPVQSGIEQSTDGGTIWTPVQAVDLSGSAKLSLPRSGTQIQLRLSVKDVAGNSATSPVQPLTVPVPPDPEKNLAEAIASLPALDAVQPSISAASAAGTTTATGEPLSATAAALAGTPLPAASTTRATTAPGGSFLTGETAQSQLDQARDQRDGGDRDGALAGFLRLQRSSVGEAATLDAIAMLQQDGDHAAVIEIGANLPSELRTDAVRIALAQSQLAFHRWADAETTVRTIRKASPQARSGLLVIAKAALGKGENARFTKICEYLASGDDEAASEAKQLRGK